MADGLNRALLLGNLCADPELRYTQGGRGVLNLRLATNESYLDKDKNRQERTDFHNVVVWGKRGEALSKFLTKGSSIFIEGSIRTSSYDDKDGNKRYKTEIVASNVILAGGKRGDGEQAGGAPRGGGSAGGSRRPSREESYDPDTGEVGGGFDDIPFVRAAHGMWRP